MPAYLKLNAWAREVEWCFDQTLYLVGSSLFSKKWRDIDVRIILEDDEWERWFGNIDRVAKHTNARWSAIMTAFSIWAADATGLPVDFQIYARSQVTAEEWDQPRCALGIYPRQQP